MTLRAKKKDAFAKNKQDLEDCIDGVRAALGVLRDYFGGGGIAHEAAGEENTGIIGLPESDFSTMSLREWTSQHNRTVSPSLR